MRLPRRIAANWTVAAPLLALAALVPTWGRDLPVALAGAVMLLLGGAVLASVHHAEVVAHRVGEPYGSLVLAVAVTIIEVGLIVALMASGDPGKTSTLARDTVFSAVMITCNGIAGLCLLTASLRHRVAVFNAEGAGAALSTVATLATLSLVLPTFTTSKPGPEFSTAQLTFAAVASLALYGLFVAMQTVRHRDYFLPVNDHPADRLPATGLAAPTDARPVDGLAAPAAGLAAPTDGRPEPVDGHAAPPTARRTALSLGLLLVALVAVVGDAKAVSPTIERGVAAAGLPLSVVGVVIALLVLAPETIAAVRAARRGRMQTSLNLAYGSAMASIGLTIPAIAVASIWLDGALVLGLGPTHMVLLGLTVIVGILTVVPGRATLLHAGVHLAILAAFLFLAVSP